MLLVNPHNPLGQCYHRDALIAYMQLAQKHKIHLIMDEVYALSVYNHSQPNATSPAPFTSALAINWAEYIDPTFFHLLYGFSKDFAMGGLRLGCIWSKNDAVLRAIGGLAFYSWPSNVCEAIAVAILENESWVETFIQTGQRRLGERSALARSVLDGYKIPYVSAASAGFFLWLDIRPLLAKSLGKPANHVSWEDERAFNARMKSQRVYLTSGKALSSEQPGFVRLCFAKDETEVRKGLKRFYDALVEIQPTP
jgi:1-aminocyclopropane-1-carboxylate synthase